MKFNYTSLRGKLSENELEIVRLYVERNKEGIFKELTEIDSVVAPIPIKEVPLVNNNQIEDVNATFSFTNEGETIVVDLVE